MTPDTIELFCDHEHDGLIEELMADYGCASRQELHGILLDALQWADKHYLGFVEESGDGFAWTVYTGAEVNCYRGRRAISMWADESNSDCSAYRQLLKAAVALFCLTTPILRRGVERPVADWEDDPARHYYDHGHTAFEDAEN